MATSSEGKTSEESAADSTVTDTPLCDACEDDKAVKYCLVCPGSLCDDCTKSHMKSKLTKDHTLCNIYLSRLGSSYNRSDKAVDGLSKCLKHHDKELDLYCKNCSCFICDVCKSDHRSHGIMPARNDISVYRTAYHDHMKNTMDEVHDLEQYKIILEKTIPQYKEACTEVDNKAKDLIQTIKDNADRLKGELSMVHDKLTKILGDNKSGLIKEIEDSDEKMLHTIPLRKVEDCEIMSHALALSRKDRDHLCGYKKNISKQIRTLVTRKILPYSKEIDSIKDDVGVYFSTERPANYIMERYTGTMKENIINVHNSNGKEGFRFNKSSYGNGTIIHEKDMDGICELDDNLNVVQNIKCDIKLWNIVTVYPNEHIAIHAGGSILSLLDNNFKIMFSEKKVSRYFRAICYYAPHQFTLCENKDTKMHLSIVSVKGTSFMKQKKIISIADITNHWYMELCPDKELLYVACAKSRLLYRVNLSKSEFTEHDVSTRVEESIRSLFVDGNGNALIGDEKGTVHKFDQLMNHEIIAKIDVSVRDVFVKNGQLLVSSKDNKIHVFSP